MMAVLRPGKLETSIRAILYPPVIYSRLKKTENDPSTKSVWICELPGYHDLGPELSSRKKPLEVIRRIVHRWDFRARCF
jgi:hypothetical protein